MIRTFPLGTRVRLVVHKPGSPFVRCRRLEDNKEFDWRVEQLRASGGTEEIHQVIARLDAEYSPPATAEEEGCA